MDLEMANVLHYQSTSSGTRPDLNHGRTAAIIAAVSAAWMVYLSHQLRMNMVGNSGEWCGNSRMHAETGLYMAGLFLLVPAFATYESWRAKTWFRLSRTSLAIAVLGWLFYVVSTQIGLSL